MARTATRSATAESIEDAADDLEPAKPDNSISIAGSLAGLFRRGKEKSSIKPRSAKSIFPSRNKSSEKTKKRKKATKSSKKGIKRLRLSKDKGM